MAPQISVSQRCLGHAKECFQSLHGQQKQSLETLQKSCIRLQYTNSYLGTFSLFSWKLQNGKDKVREVLAWGQRGFQTRPTAK